MACKIAIIGAYDLLGRELVNFLAECSFPDWNVRLFDDNGVGTAVSFRSSEILIEELSEHSLKEGDFQYMIFLGSEVTTAEYSLIAQESRCVVIDASGFFKNSLHVPIVIPEINGHLLKNHRIVSVPNCISVQLALSLHPIHLLSPVKNISISTYQSVSGRGDAGVYELEHQHQLILDGQEAETNIFPKQIAFNVIPEIGEIFENGWTQEELTTIKEIQDIFQDQSMEVSVHCVRVPVVRGHSMAVSVETNDVLEVNSILESWEKFSPITLYGLGDSATPWELEGTIDIGISRIRKDIGRENKYHFWSSADNILLGMVFNIVQIIEYSENLNLNKV